MKKSRVFSKMTFTLLAPAAPTLWISVSYFLPLPPPRRNIFFLNRAGEGRRPWATTISPSVPPHLTLPGKTTFSMVYLGPVKCDFKKSSRVTQKSTTQTIFSTPLKINILCVEFLNCFTMKSLTNLTEYCILKYHKVG